MNRNKYGLRFTTIKYWQESARYYMLHHGSGPFLSMAMRYYQTYQTMSAKQVCNLAIMLAEAGKLDYLKK